MSSRQETDHRPSEDGVIEIGSVIIDLLKGWLTITCFALVFGAAAAFAALSLPNQYSAVARIIIEPEQANIATSSAAEVAKPVSEAMIESNAEIIKSNRILEQVVEALALHENEMFLGADTDLTDAPIASEIANVPQRLAMKKLNEALTVRPVGNSLILSIRATTIDPILSAEIANTVAEKFIATEQRIKVDQAQEANVWLLERVEYLQQRVSESSRELQTFRTQTGDVTERTVTETARLLVSLKREAEQRQTQTANPARDRLLERIADTEAELVELTSSIVTLNELERQADADSVLYERLLERAREMQELETFQVGGVRVVSDALPPLEKSAPSRKLIVLLSLVAGIALGAGVVILRTAR